MARNLRRIGLSQILHVVHNLQDYTVQIQTSPRFESAGAGRELPNSGSILHDYLSGAAVNCRDQYTAVLEENSRVWYNIGPL